VNVPIRDAAAKTVIVPVVEAPPVLLVLVELGEPLLEQPAAATAASVAAKTAKRRIVNPPVQILVC
jgi:hypothetical protein